MTSICTVQEGARERIFVSPCTGAVAPTVKIRWPRYKAQSPNQEYKNKNEQSVRAGASAVAFILTMQKRDHWWHPWKPDLSGEEQVDKGLLYFSVSSLCLNISKIKCFETSMSTGSLEKKNAEGKGSEYGYQFSHLRVEILSCLPRHNARRKRRMQKSQEHRGQSLFLLRELPGWWEGPGSGEDAALYIMLSERFQTETQSTRKPKHPHTEMAYVLYCLTGRKQLFAQAVRPTYQKNKQQKKVGARCKTRNRMKIRKDTKDVRLLNFH